MNPISPTGQNASPAAALFEAVLRYSSAGELRDQQTRMNAPARKEDADEVPGDESILGAEGSQSAPKGGMPRGEGAPRAPATQAQHHHAARGANHHGVDVDGMEQQQEALLAQRAAEQHGRQETQRDTQARLQRSTREMISGVEGAEPAAAEKAPGPAPAAKDAPPDEAGSADATTAGAVPAEASPTASGGTLRPAGNVVAAVVGSGLHGPQAERVSGRTVEQDLDAEQVDGSQEATGARATHSVGRSRGRFNMESSLGFDGDPDEDRRGRYDESASGEGSSERRQDDGGEPDRVSDHQEQAPSAAADDARRPDLKASTPGFDGYLPDRELAVAAASVPQEPEPPAVDASQPDTVEHHIVLSPGLDLADHEEYFFFDDVRYQADEAAS